jgi:hypothetical protein
MSEAAVEAIILAINALGCGIPLFVSGVARKIMNDMEPLEFKKFMNLLGRAAMSDPASPTRYNGGAYSVKKARHCV